MKKRNDTIPSHMSVQTSATERNSQVELVIEYVLERFCDILKKNKEIENVSIDSQALYESDFARDVWDHRICFTDCKSKRKTELWCQTTCYKGSASGKPESNKTYEVRETLVEAISIRNKPLAEGSVLRTIHFTVGSKIYTYGWFKDAKDTCFDISLYFDSPESDVFELIQNAIGSRPAEVMKKDALQTECKDKSELGITIIAVVDLMLKWHRASQLPVGILADKQFELVNNLAKKGATSVNQIISNSHNGGMDIKGKANQVLFGDKSKDNLLNQVVASLLKTNPFLHEAFLANTNWIEWCDFIKQLAKRHESITGFLVALWDCRDNRRLVLRRVLLRLHTDDSVGYIQDINVPGITEHNLYGGTHNSSQILTITKTIASQLSNNGINTTQALCESLCSDRTSRLIKAARWFEAKNGAQLKPSFNYIALALEERGYKITSILGVAKPIGYHASFTSDLVRPYSNIKLICNNKNKPIAILKAKYFSEAEFPRRCKEEAYVGLTLRYKYIDDAFAERYGIPIIMFIDMPEGFSPPEHALRRLHYFGWQIAFDVDQVIALT